MKYYTAAAYGVLILVGIGWATNHDVEYGYTVVGFFGAMFSAILVLAHWTEWVKKEYRAIRGKDKPNVGD